MTIQENALRMPQSASVRTGIHLVYSRTWQYENRPKPLPQRHPQLLVQHHAQPSATLQARNSARTDTLILAAAALAAPAVWIGHALLLAMHVI
jgi:hypothetical protein